MIDDLLGVAGFAITMITVVLMMLFGITCLWVGLVQPKQCEAFSEVTGLKTQHKFWYGCFVTMPDGTVLPSTAVEAIMKQKYQVEITK